METFNILLIDDNLDSAIQDFLKSIQGLATNVVHIGQEAINLASGQSTIPKHSIPLSASFKPSTLYLYHNPANIKTHDKVLSWLIEKETDLQKLNLDLLLIDDNWGGGDVSHESYIWGQKKILPLLFGKFTYAYFSIFTKHPDQPERLTEFTNSLCEIPYFGTGKVNFIDKGNPDTLRTLITLIMQLKIERTRREIGEKIAAIHMIDITSPPGSRKTFGPIVGGSVDMNIIYDKISKVAPFNSTVLIYGETGTGKEHIARSIHYNSPRKDKPFFAINCAAIPETLLESELFGYEKGAFTGAMTRHAGLFEQANGSSLFLDEIGDLTLRTQAKLLRAIQEMEIRTIGGKRNIELDVRIISATNKRLEEEIAKGRFREDLYYRLKVIDFLIPPLRKRMADIELLVEYFLKRLNKKHGGGKRISNEALQFLMKYSWPGNVRELENKMESAYILCDNGVMTHNDFNFLINDGNTELDHSNKNHTRNVLSSTPESSNSSPWQRPAGGYKILQERTIEKYLKKCEEYLNKYGHQPRGINNIEEFIKERSRGFSSSLRTNYADWVKFIKCGNNEKILAEKGLLQILYLQDRIKDSLTK